MKKNIILFIFLLLNYVGYSQEYIDDSNFEDKINQKSAFDDDETNIVVEFPLDVKDISEPSLDSAISISSLL